MTNIINQFYAIYENIDVFNRTFDLTLRAQVGEKLYTLSKDICPTLYERAYESNENCIKFINKHTVDWYA
jgi:hypothetical protein